MTEIVIKLPQDLQFMSKMSELEFSMWAQRIIREKLEEIARFRRIVAKSKATEKDVEELTDKINQALAKHYAKYR